MATVNLGRVGFVNKGDYVETSPYKLNDIVTANGAVYACVQPVPANSGIEISNESYWQKWVDNKTVTSISELLTTSSEVDTVFVKDYHLDTEGGGGVFVWDAIKLKSEHNGGTVIDPTAVFPTDWTNQTQLGTWFDTSNAGTGVWVRKYDGAVNVKWFGAVGDGVTDDTLAFVLEAGSTYDLHGKEFLIGSKTLPNCTIKNGTIKLLSNSRLTINEGFEFDNVVIDCQDLPVNVAAIYVNSGRFIFNSSEVKNINSTLPVSAQYGIIIKAQGGVDFSIRGSLFKNITNTDDGVPTGSGFCGGILFFGDAPSLTGYEGSQSGGLIDNCNFNNIYTQVGSGANIDNTDADAIRFYIDGLTEGFDTIFPVTISNCGFKDIQKSCFKINGWHGVTIKNINIEAKRTDFTMLAAIRIQYAYDCVIDNVTFDGNSKYLFAISAKRCQITNTNTTFGSNIEQGIFIQDIGITSYGILVDGGLWSQVSRLIGTNYNEGTSVENMTVSNIVAGHNSPLSPYIYIPYSSNLTLDNIAFSTTVANDVLAVAETRGMVVKNCDFKSGRRAIVMDSNNQQNLNLTISGCKFETTGTGIGYRLITIRATTGTALTPDGITIENCSLKRYSFTSATNDEFMIIQGSLISINNIRMNVEQVLSNDFAAVTAIQIISSSKIHISDVFYSCNFTYNASWAGWAVFLNNCTKVTIYNIHGGCRRGIELSGTSNCHYNNIAAVVGQAIVNVTGGTNITAGTDLAAVL